MVKEERDARSKEQEIAQKAFEDMQQQLELVSSLLTEKQLESNIALEEAKLNLLQLHQIQKELNYYFLQSRSKEKLLQLYQSQQCRAKILMSNALIKVS